MQKQKQPKIKFVAGTKICRTCKKQKSIDNFNFCITYSGTKCHFPCCKNCYTIDRKEYCRRIKMECISEYGGKCKCCEEDRIEFLSLDHINGGGKECKEKIGVRGGHNYYLWLKKHNYPKKGLRVLCMNCNHSIGIYGYCPHKKRNSDRCKDKE